MNAIIFKESGSWTDTLELTETILNEPAADEVQIKILARPVNPSDEMFIKGIYRQKPSLPQIAGLEGTGIIVKCGPSIEKSLVGKHAAFRTPGTWAEKINLKLSQFRLVPGNLPPETACQLSLNTLTAFALLEQAGLSANQWLLLTAANSSVGRQIIQLAKQKNINVIAIVRKDEHKNLLFSLGARAVLNSETQNIEEEIKTITGMGANAILDAVGGRLGTILFNVAAPFGKIIIYGRLSNENVSFSYGTVIYKNMKMEGFGIDSWMKSKTEEELGSIWEELTTLASSGALYINYDEIFGLANYKEAITCYKNTGKRIILK
ncbi:MAG: zinc-dependent alcohol dehydrogenase family protein [Bacteroidota bacterium]|nr:zinc-dependent alcohol dehydrogenase family protein [Bacteroidota bacterium]